MSRDDEPINFITGVAIVGLAFSQLHKLGTMLMGIPASIYLGLLGVVVAIGGIILQVKKNQSKKE